MHELVRRPGWAAGRLPRQMVDAVRHLVAGGITWRAMPADFPEWDRGYAFFRRWPRRASGSMGLGGADPTSGSSQGDARASRWISSVTAVW
ncbi:transposase [Streptomyces sp. NPDC017949]|uniref:transposase n=2 Tax=unclassified Streptomyces TaxID=2593676 RepID=UPI00379C6FA5